MKLPPLLLTLLLTSTITLAQLNQSPGASTNARQNRELFKGFTGYRLHNDSHQMVYYHDLTIAVVELGDSTPDDPQTPLLNCELIEVFSDEQREHALQDLKKVSRPRKPYNLRFGDMMELIAQCESLDPKNINDMIQRGSFELQPSNSEGDDSANEQSPILSGILPGTKWCGTGDIAKNYFDLGAELVMDKCCRKHDLCPVKVKSNGSRYNLSNKSLYTKSHCACDDELAKCLRKVNKPAADFMGSIYFNIIRIQCIADGKNGRHYRSSRNY